MHSARRNFRGLRLVAGTLIVLTTTAGAATLAFADPSKPAPHDPPRTAVAAGAHGNITQNAYRAVEALVAQKIITQAQADAVQRQVVAGSVDPKTLVDSGTLSNDQMRQVANSLTAVKRAG
jgi:hypothetical protein